MGEIEFKAKRLDDGEWVCGHYCELAGRKYIIPDYSQFRDIHDADLESSFTEIIPETICQWTGLLDKQGAKIFEGDIVIFDKLFTAIKYFEKYGMFGLVGKSKYREFDENEPMGSGGSSTSYKPYVLSEYYQKRIEVVGNIHDKAHQKQALIDMMRGDEELGLYDD